MAKGESNQRTRARVPQQDRSRHKVRLILEAATRILEKDGMDRLTTNATASLAGVSIGTLYQYFPDKEAILDTLADQEFEGMAGRVRASMQDASHQSTQDRVTAMVRAVAASYGRRHQAHRLVMAHSLSRGNDRLAPLLAELRALLARERATGAIRTPIDPVDAFVLTHAFTGVLRAMLSAQAPPQAAMERSLTRLVLAFLSGPIAPNCAS